MKIAKSLAWVVSLLAMWKLAYSAVNAAPDNRNHVKTVNPFNNSKEISGRMAAQEGIRDPPVLIILLQERHF